MIRGGPSGPPLSFRHRTDFEGKFWPLISFKSGCRFLCHSFEQPFRVGKRKGTGGNSCGLLQTLPAEPGQWPVHRLRGDRGARRCRGGPSGLGALWLTAAGIVVRQAQGEELSCQVLGGRSLAQHWTGQALASGDAPRQPYPRQKAALGLVFQFQRTAMGLGSSPGEGETEAAPARFPAS